MKALTSLLCAGLVSLAGAGFARGAAQVGQAAPEFTLTDLGGKAYSLSAFKGRTVVLEWTNPDCPFVQKHYDRSGNIPNLQKAATADGVIWLQINSAAPGGEGDHSAAEVHAWQERTHTASTAYLRDPEGRVGKLYDARTTPHIFIVDATGTLVYAGGIDNIRSTNVDDLKRAKNYVAAALSEIKEGKPVSTPHSRPYGCAVKYAD